MFFCAAVFWVRWSVERLPATVVIADCACRRSSMLPLAIGRAIPNPTLKRDCAKARSPLAPRWGL